MDVVLFAGGAGSRTRPMIAAPLPKHTIYIGDRPLLWHVMQTIIAGGADRIIVSLNGDRPELTILTITAFELDIPICYTHSDNAVSNGPVYDLRHVRSFVRPNAPFGVLFADAFFTHPLDLRGAPAPHIWTMQLPTGTDASPYGQVLSTGRQVVDIIEKPTVERSRLIQTGALKLPYEALAVADTLCATGQAPMHFGHLTSHYVTLGDMTHTELPANGFVDCGRPEDIQRANQLALTATRQD